MVPHIWMKCRQIRLELIFWRKRIFSAAFPLNPAVFKAIVLKQQALHSKKLTADF